MAAFFISEDLLNDKSSESRRVALPGKAGHDCGNKYQGNFTHKKTGIRILVCGTGSSSYLSVRTSL